jgi:hypothetical protein
LAGRHTTAVSVSSITSGVFVFSVENRKLHTGNDQGNAKHGLRGVLFVEDRDAEGESVDQDLKKS